MIGTANAAEFFLTSAISAAFLAAILSGHGGAIDELSSHGAAVLGLIVGGIVAALLAGFIAKLVPHRTLMVMVAC